MNNIKQGLTLLSILVGIGFTSCSDENPWHGSDTEGRVYLNLSSDGRVMRHQTRADDTVSPIIPETDQFGIKLYNFDGSFSQTWSNVANFNKENSFPIGDYRIEAFYGDTNKEGFELPSFKGVNDVHVAPQSTTDVEVVATLANAMVSVRYTDLFTQNFSSYSAAVQSEGHDWVVFAQNEDRPAYINAEGSLPVKLSLTLTNKDGKQVTVEPANFVVEPRRHYVVTVNAVGNVTSGDLVLDIQFDDEVVNETVSISLGDDLFTSPAPEVRAKNFNPSEELSKYEYDNISASPEFDIFSFGGFSEVTLSVISDNYTPSFGRQVQLVNASQLIQDQLEAEGIEVKGLFKNLDKMAVVKVKDFIEKLPVGTYKIQVQAKDAMTRLSEPVDLKVKVDKVEMELSSAGDISFCANEVVIELGTNVEKVAQQVTFKAPDANNRFVDVPIKSIELINGPNGKKTRGDLPLCYRVVLGVDPVMKHSLEIEANFARLTKNVTVGVETPEYTATVDAFAKYAIIKIEGDEETRKLVMENAKIYNGSSQISSGNISRNVESGLITISGLNSSADYPSFKIALGDFEKQLSFTTESAADVPNGNFAATTQTININPINTGFQFGIKFVVTSHTQLKSAIVCSTPNDWANLNPLTCNPNSSFMNTWYVVPSTFDDNGAVAIRSVGYNHAGRNVGETTTRDTYYNTNSPSESDLNKAAGELFLGSYTLNSRVDGQAWSSRPTTLTFDYKYAPLNNEQAEAYIKLISASGSVLSEQTVYLSAAGEMTSKTVTLNNYPFGQKAAKIMLGFKSTKSGVTPAIYIPKGSELREPQITATNYLTNPPQITTNQYKAVAIGSVLTVDNVKLGYDAAPSVTAVRRK